ncbi:MAG: helix-hairpin-helix domain-containing protein [Pseudomonadota bacterium]|nr:helix-hairpin-helix domain-containing protein [Pseudomonadota bacterium]
MRSVLRKLLVCLTFLFAIALPADAAVDVNTADAAELETLPGIGPSKAAAIILYRTENGPFTAVDDLDNVPGIGVSTLASLRDQVTVGKGGKPASGGGATSGASTTPPAASTPPTASATATVAAGACSVDINTADVIALEDLPGIGSSKAAAILQHRVDNGPYASCDALDDVSGIGPSTIAGLKDCCRVK